MGTSNSCKTAAVLNLLGKGSKPGQDVHVLPDKPQSAESKLSERDGGRLAELAANIRASESQNQQLAQLMLSNAVDIGRWLTEAKAMVPHGEWGKWLKEKVDYSQSKAQNLMRLYQEYGTGQGSLFRSPKSQALGNLNVTKALQLLAIPEGSEREEFLAEHDVATMTTRELQTAIKERDAALKAAEQAEADRRAADAAREKLSRDMELANERIAGLNAEVEGHSARAREARGALARLEKELEELRSRPVDVAVETDTAAIEAARKEAEAAMGDKLDRAIGARDKALEKRYELETALAKAKTELEQAKAEAQKQVLEAKRDFEQATQEREQALDERDALLARVKQAEKKAALAANEDLVLFRTLFDQAQEQINKLGGMLMKFRNKDAETAGKLQNALLALSDAVRKVAEG